MRHTEPPASLFDFTWSKILLHYYASPLSIGLLLRVPCTNYLDQLISYRYFHHLKNVHSARFRIPQQPPTGLEPSLAAHPRPAAHLSLAHLCALCRLGGGSLLL
jgi:hypothetical protein